MIYQFHILTHAQVIKTIVRSFRNHALFEFYVEWPHMQTYLPDTYNQIIIKVDFPGPQIKGHWQGIHAVWIDGTSFTNNN